MRNSEEVIDLIINICEEDGISISELARRVDMAKSAISRYFNKSREFPINRIGSFADALSVTPEYLLGVEFPLTDKKKEERKISLNNEGNQLILKIDIDPIESELIELLKKLNEEGKKEALRRVEEMLYNPNYTKH